MNAKLLSAILFGVLATACASSPKAASSANAEASCRSYALPNNPDVSPPRLLSGTQPPQPANSSSGYVCIRVTITESGSVIDPVVVQTDNHDWADSFLRVLTSWRYEPATRGSAKVLFHTTLFAKFPQTQP